MLNSQIKKYHQAAYTYILMGVAYFVVFYTTMPPHDFSIRVKIIAPLVGLALMGLAWFIFKGYRKLTMVLAFIYALRVLVSIAALLFGKDHVAVQYVLPLLIFTFYMLGRAVWDWKP